MANAAELALRALYVGGRPRMLNNLDMNKPDLDAVMARRQAVANELAALDKMRAEMEAEDQDLVVAERVLKRLASLGTPETSGKGA